MNQESVKEKLLELQDPVEEFTVVFSGKRSKKVNGLYKPEEREILIHNKNLETEDSLISAAIHEFAHHIQVTTSVSPVSPTAHTTGFSNTFHTLLSKAESLGMYRNVFRTDEEFISLTRQIKEEYLSVNGELMLSFGKVMEKARELCLQHKVNFEEYIDRELCMNRSTAKCIMKSSSLELNPELGYDNMRIVAGIADEEKAKEAQEAFSRGESQAMVKNQFDTKEEPESRLEFMLKEKERILSSMERLTDKLGQVESSIEELQEKDPL